MDVTMIPIAAILMPLVLVPTIIVMKHRQQQREWEHLERLKAMEIQMPIPTAHAMAAHRGVAAIGAGVPSAAVLAAFLTSIIFSSEGGDAVAVPAIAWGCAPHQRLALATSLILAFMQRKASREPEIIDPMSNGKPAFDPDAFDVVSSRG